MIEAKFTQPPPALARLAAQPGDAKALRRLCADFAAAATPGTELAAAAVNLIERIADGSVAANASTTGLLGEAWAGLGDVAEPGTTALVERLDACASGLGEDMSLEDDQRTVGATAPPLLTTRADGSTVLPGTFEPAPASDPPPAAGAAPPALTSGAAIREGSAAIDQLQSVAAALEAACGKLAAQLGTLELVAGEELQRLASELSATGSAIDRQRRALADWVEWARACEGHDPRAPR